MSLLTTTPIHPSNKRKCPWEEDWAYAEAVCRQAGNVPLEAVPLQKEYWDQVGDLDAC